MARFGGLTLNERLLVSGLLERFDEAVHTQNHEEAVKLLLKTGMRKLEAEDTVTSILSDPKAYGYGQDAL